MAGAELERESTIGSCCRSDQVRFEAAEFAEQKAEFLLVAFVAETLVLIGSRNALEEALGLGRTLCTGRGQNGVHGGHCEAFCIIRGKRWNRIRSKHDKKADDYQKDS
jgi:hypothetical protein